ncbi:MAG: hypothetical protein H7267_06475 [Sandarakinorhabdus sp.]|nr:hypothetical protein [Sandarakinorhabdus sp.]
MDFRAKLRVMTTAHIVILLISIVMWVGAAAVILHAVRRMNLFGRKSK